MSDQQDSESNFTHDEPSDAPGNNYPDDVPATDQEPPVTSIVDPLATQAEIESLGRRQESWWYRHFGSHEGLAQMAIVAIVVIVLSIAAWAILWSGVPSLHNHHCSVNPTAEGCHAPGGDDW